MTIKKTEKRSITNFFRQGFQFTLLLFLLSSISCSKDDAVNEPESNELSVNAKVSANTVDKAKLQMGNPARDKSDKPSQKFKGITHDQASFSRDNKSFLIFKANGSKNRSELRYKSGFDQGAKKTFQAKVDVVDDGKKHEGFTVMQLHNDAQKSKGPALKIEYHGDSKGKGFFKVKYRTKNKGKESDIKLKTGTSGTFKIVFNNRNVKIYVDNSSKAKLNYKVDNNGWGKVDSKGKGKFYWKTGAYNQKGGQSHSKISNISW